MLKQNYPLLAGLLLTLCTFANAAEKPRNFTHADLSAASTLRERALADPTAFALVESLTTEVGPRPAGSPGDRAAVAWAQREMQKLGFANVRTLEAVVPHWERGEAEFQVLAPYPQSMPTLALKRVQFAPRE